MATIEELKDVLKDTLEDKGVLSQIRAKIRAEIFTTLNDNPQDKSRLSEENMIINELIREYLLYNDYQHSASVFIPESGQPQAPPFKRDYIAKRLKVIEDKNTQELPLLYGLVFGVKKLLQKDLEEEKQRDKLYQDFGTNKFPNPDETMGKQNINESIQQQQNQSRKGLGENMFSVQ